MRGKGIDSGKDGLIAGNVMGTFTHMYFTDAFAGIFVDEASHFSNG